MKSEHVFLFRCALWIGVALGSFAQWASPLPWYLIVFVLMVLAVVILGLTIVDISREIEHDESR